MKLKYIAGCLLLVATTWSCKKNDYIKGGEPTDVNRYKDISTYDFLKTQPLYDTLVQLIDAAGLKDKLNAENTTFYAPSDYSIMNYLQARTLMVQKQNQYAKFGLDSLLYYLANNKDNTRDSLLMYQVKQSLDFNKLVTIGDVGAKLPSSLPGDSVVISFETTRDGNQGYNSTVSSVPQLQYFSQLWWPYALSSSSPAKNIPTAIGVRTLCKTSFIATKSGYVNALDNGHTLFFFGTKVPYVDPKYNHANWAIVNFSSEETSGEGPVDGRAADIIDGDINTYWHSRWSSNEAQPPHWVVIDLSPGAKQAIPFTRFQYAHRQSLQRMVKNLYVDISNDNATWTTLSGSPFVLPQQTGLISFTLASPVSARYVRLRIPSTADVYDGSIYAAIGEFAVLP